MQLKMPFDISGVLRDAHIDELPAFLNVSTHAGANSMRKQLTRWSSTPSRLKARSSRARCLKSALRSDTRLRPLFEEFSKVEPTFDELLTPPTELEEESYSQLFFQSAVLRPLNHIPLFVAILTFMKKTIIPAIMVAMPLLTIIAPYIIVRYIMGMPLTFTEYVMTAKNMYLGQTNGNPMASIKQLTQIAGFIFTTVHSVYQPIQTMMHIRAIDATVRKKADDIVRGVELYEQIRAIFDEYGIRTPRLPLPVDIMGDRHRLIAFVLEHSFHIRLLLDWIGAWDVSVALAQCKTVTCVEWTERPEIFVKSTCDTRIRPEKQKRFTIQLGGDVQKNILLTGPNRGGKSTVLRALIRSVLLAHTYGVAVGSSCRMTPLDWVKSSLRIEDLPGSQSLFEREIAFAKDTLH
jgi:hypothetical protein